VGVCDPIIKQHAVVSIQLNIVACPTYQEKFIRDNTIAPVLLLAVVTVTLPLEILLLIYLLTDIRMR